MSFKKGMIPWNKGTKSVMKANKTSFKKGEHRSIKTEFKKGMTSWVKGKSFDIHKGNQYAKGNSPNRTSFKKGNISWNEGTKGAMPEPWNKGKKIPEISGENNGNWKGGITTENNKARQSLEYIIWRNEVYKKDYWTCRICGSKKDIVAHHLKLFSEFPELRFSVDNGIVLCRSCHLKLHKQLNDLN